MTRFTSIRVRVSREQILLAINVVESACAALMSIIPLLKGLLKSLEAAEDIITERKGK